MFEGIGQLIKHVKLLAEVCVYVGVALLLYYWSVTISFFPPALSLGDVAKFLVIAVVGAFTFSFLTLYTVCFGAVPFVLFLYASRFFRMPLDARKKTFRAFKAIKTSDLKIMLVVGSFFLPYYMVSDVVHLTARNAFGLLLASVAFAFIVGAQILYMSRPGVVKESEEDLERKSFGKGSLVVGMVFGVVSAFVVWGGPNAFFYATMKQAGVMSLGQNIFLDKKFCPLLGSAFVVHSLDDYCYVERADILFQGMGDKVLLANIREGFRLSVPSDAVHAVSGYTPVDTSLTPETTKPAQGGLSH
ncbi:hypothetical protein [Marinobacter nauticus]|uniref:hypothetical protein n=1 Tax=Marinobacter nauticus TaxID=2743 RepID=UPI001C560A48|nr:hypothetical protein [Marinobacter nauticus]MBW3197032.1 hypothetical protein [Marinobacter nauticus]MBY6182442.1 hypothetical protein [Marinobacter nauticus]